MITNRDRVIRAALGREVRALIAKNVVSGAWIHNVETDLIVRRDVASEDELREAADAYERLLNTLRKDRAS